MGKKIQSKRFVIILAAMFLPAMAGAQSIDVYERVYWWDGSENYYVSTEAQDTMSASYNMKLPLVIGDPCSVLTTDGTDALGWTRKWSVGTRDPDEWDWELTDLTTDGDWHDLDCSSIVDVGTKIICFRVSVQDDAVSSDFYMRKKGHTNQYASYPVKTQVVDVSMTGNLRVPCNDEYVVEYRTEELTFNSIYIVVTHWEGYLDYSAVSAEKVTYASEDVVYAGEDVVYP